MFRNRVTKLNALLVLGLIISFDIYAVTLPDLAPPKVQLVDEFGVNVHSGQVQSSLETVSIGGAMGLSHNISNFTNNFSITGYRGYQDKFFARGRVTELDTRLNQYKNVMRVHDMSGTADFWLIDGGVIKNFGAGPVTNYTYAAVSDPRNTLVRRTDGVYWTKPDGTEVVFEGALNGSPDHVGTMKQIRYPNGFIIDIIKVTDQTGYVTRRITTNTGFALKYIHHYDSADALMAPAKYAIRYDSVTPRVEPELWARENPKYVQAINTSVESCLTSACVTNWPKAEFKWPAGMPRAIYLGDSTFRVTGATGGVTEYYFRSYDLALNEAGNVVEGHTRYQRNSPRLIGIKPEGSNEQLYKYTYKNVFNTQSSEFTTWFYLSGEAGQVTQVHRYGVASSGYSFGDAYYSSIQNSGGGYIQRVLPKVDQYPGAIHSVTTRDGQLTYEVSYRNFPSHYVWNSGMVESYGYDARGNMTSHTKGAVTFTASYPASCDNPKSCNKPTWTSDAKGNKTWFTYHSQSGEVETITYPADKNGLVRQVRFEYTPHQANYYPLNGGSKIAGSPIWLKTAERTCTSSNTLGSTCASANDEVVTQYEYNSDNLFLTGMTITAAEPVNMWAPGGASNTIQVTTKRTCFQYDKYGNKIGETEPNAFLSQCPRQ